MAKQDNTPQGFEQAQLLSYHDISESDVADLRALAHHGSVGPIKAITQASLQTLLGDARAALAVVRRGEPGKRGRIVAVAEGSFVHQFTGAMGLIRNIFIHGGLPPITSEQVAQIELALIECLVSQWADRFNLHEVEVIGPTVSVGERHEQYQEMGFTEIVDGSLYIRRRLRPIA